MKTRGKESLFFHLEVPIHQLDAGEVGFGLELVHAHYLNHPIEHSGSKASVNFVVAQKIFWRFRGRENLLQTLPVFFAEVLGRGFLDDGWTEYSPVGGFFVGEGVVEGERLKVLVLEDGLVGGELDVLEGGEKIDFFVDMFLVVFLFVEEFEGLGGVLEGKIGGFVHGRGQEGFYDLFLLYKTVMILSSIIYILLLKVI